MEWYCKSCGAGDSRVCNGDNHICTICGDTEGLIYLPDLDLSREGLIDFLQKIVSEYKSADYLWQLEEIMSESELRLKEIKHRVD